MELRASSCSSEDTDSTRAAEMAARSLRDAFDGDALKAVVVYATVNHDQSGLLEHLGKELGAAVPIIGCSSQGIMTRGNVREGGFGLGIMALGGSAVKTATALEREIGGGARQEGERREG